MSVIKKYWYIFLIVICIVFIFWRFPKNQDIVSDKEEIDRLQSKIDSLTNLKDSIDYRIDTVTIAIKETKIQYEKNRNTIINNNTSEDYKFFCEYLNRNKSRLDSINNF